MKLRGPEMGWVDILDLKLYEKASAELEAKPTYMPLRPSSSGKCARELGYALREYFEIEKHGREPRTAEVMRLLDLGHYIEEHLLDHFKKSCSELFQVRYQQQVVDGFTIKDNSPDKSFPELDKMIEGSIDSVFWSEEHRALIDVKSKKVKFSRFFSDNWEDTDEKMLESGLVERIEGSKNSFWVTDTEAFIDYLMVSDPFFCQNFWQLNFYSLSPFAKKRNIDHAAIVQYSKNDSRLREIRFAPCESIYERTRERFQSAADSCALDDINLAPREYIFGSIKCAFCDFKDACWEEEKEGADAQQEYYDLNFPKKNWPKDASKKLEEWYEVYLATLDAEGDKKQVEREIVSYMKANGIWKIKFKDGKVYKRKELKQGEVLRRAKL